MRQIPTVPCADTGNLVNLLPCPFCGSPAALEINETPDFGEVLGKKPTPANERLNFFIRCSAPPAMRCSMGNHWLESSAERAANAWNRRVHPATQTAAIESALRFIHRLGDKDDRVTPADVDAIIAILAAALNGEGK